MMCQHCVKRVSGVLDSFATVNSYEVFLEEGQVSLTLADEGTIEPIIAAISEAGYPTTLLSE